MSFNPFHVPSIEFVCVPSVALTNSMEWLTVRCKNPRAGRCIYPRHKSVCTVEPGRTHRCMTSSRVSALRFCTTSIKTFLDGVRSTPPITQHPSTVCPLLYLRFPILHSSISTTMFCPPISTGSEVTLSATSCLRNPRKDDTVIEECPVMVRMVDADAFESHK